MPLVSLSRERALYTSGSEIAQQQIRRDLAVLQEQMTSQLRINRASDDPSAFGEAKRLESLSNQYEQYVRSIDSARNWAKQTQVQLDSLSEAFATAYEYALEGVNDTLSPAERETLAKQVDSIREEVIGRINAKIGDEFAFAGNNTLTQPFTATGEPSFAVDDFSRINGDRIRSVGPAMDLKVNVNGEELMVLNPGDPLDPLNPQVTIVDTLTNLSNALRGTGTVTLDDAVAQVKRGYDRVIDVNTANGVVINRLDAAEDYLTMADQQLNDRKSVLEDADYVETLTALQKEQYNLEAALKVSSSILKTTLLNYLE